MKLWLCCVLGTHYLLVSCLENLLVASRKRSHINTPQILENSYPNLDQESFPGFIRLPPKSPCRRSPDSHQHLSFSLPPLCKFTCGQVPSFLSVTLTHCSFLWNSTVFLSSGLTLKTLLGYIDWILLPIAESLGGGLWLPLWRHVVIFPAEVWTSWQSASVNEKNENTRLVRKMMHSHNMTYSCWCTALCDTLPTWSAGLCLWDWTALFLEARESILRHQTFAGTNLGFGANFHWSFSKTISNMLPLHSHSDTIPVKESCWLVFRVLQVRIQPFPSFHVHAWLLYFAV